MLGTKKLALSKIVFHLISASASRHSHTDACRDIRESKDHAWSKSEKPELGERWNCPLQGKCWLLPLVLAWLQHWLAQLRFYMHSLGCLF